MSNFMDSWATTTINFILSSFLIGAIVLLPMILVELWLIKAGVVQNRLVIVIICVLILVFIKRIWYDELSWSIYAPMIFLFGILGINRGDFWTTMNRGKWWWKEHP
jgi:hypothetical protein